MYKSLQNAVKLSQVMLVAMSVACFSACSDDDNETTPTTPAVNQQDRNFARMAGMNNRAEIELGQLAVTRASHDSVKAFGQMMVADHTLAQNQLKTIGQNLNVAVADTLDAAHRQLRDQLNTLSGMAFDTLYMNSQIMDHQVARTVMETEIAQGQNPDLKNYASQTNPKIIMHQTHAQHIRGLLP